MQISSCLWPGGNPVSKEFLIVALCSLACCTACYCMSTLLAILNTFPSLTPHYAVKFWVGIYSICHICVMVPLMVATCRVVMDTSFALTINPFSVPPALGTSALELIYC